MSETFKLKLGQRGTLTIPKALRTAYHLEPGNPLTLIDLGGVFVLYPGSSQVNRVAGQLQAEWEAHGINLEEMLAELRAIRAIYQLGELRQEIADKHGVIAPDLLAESRQERLEELPPPEPDIDN